MIIECEKCGTKYNLDETLVQTTGSKVKCSRCKHVFTAYHEPALFPDEAQTVAVSQQELEETLGADIESSLDEGLTGDDLADDDIDFENIFEESLEDMEKVDDELFPDDHQALEKEVVAPDTDREADADLLKGPPPPTEEIFGDEPQEEDTEMIPDELPEKRGGVSRFIISFLVVVLLFLGAGAAVFLWAPQWIPDSLSILRPVEKQKSMDIGVRRLSFKDVNGFFVDSRTEGRLFVITGKVKNDYLDKRSFILVKGTVLDDKGQVVESKMAYAGNSYAEEEIKALPMQKMTNAMKNRYGLNKQNVNVPSGGSVPFTVVFQDLPKNLGEFTVEAVSSSPGT
ncbi:MAG: DUF3426 domain-containing protein [Thermodesulfobacteriota bacterium]|nr:DUF3426 domain-containing protein [Thermodesulfobacteriota bacterium]